MTLPSNQFKMRKPASLIFFFCLFSFHLSAQNEIDSLLKLVQAAPEDTNKIWLYRDLYKAYYWNDQVEEMIPTAKNGLALAKKLDYFKGTNFMVYYLASALDINGRSSEAIQLFEEGLALVQEKGKEDEAADYFINLGVAHYMRADYEKAIQNYMGAHDIYLRLNEKDKLSKVLNNIAIIYRNQKKYVRAEEIYQQSYGLKKEVGDSTGIAASLQNLAAMSIRLEKYDTAMVYVQQALQIYTELKSEQDIASCYTTLGEVYLSEEKFDEAKRAFEKALDYFGKNPETIYTPNTLQGLAQVALKEEKYPTAETYLRQSLDMARSFERRENTLSVLKDLSTALSQQGKKAEAFDVIQEAYLLRDSLTEETKLSLLEEMQAKFDVKQKDNELKISQLELSERTRQRNFSIFGAITLGLLGISIFIGFKNKMKADKKLSEQKEELQKQRIFQLEQEKKLTTLSAMLEGEDKERSRIANDLHDGLGGLLTSVKSHFNSLTGEVEKDELFKKTNHLIDEACVEVRRISHNMMPRALTLSGLPGALEDLAQNIRQKGVECELEIIGMEGIDLPKATNLNLFRIIQELTNNAVKHAEAKSLLLQLIHQDNRTTVLVEDDGKGFDVTKAMQKKGLGLASIISRVEFLKGEIDWDSVPGEGTTVSLTVDG